MKFREYALPADTNYASLNEVPEDTMQVLGIYDAIDGYIAESGADGANRLLDEFADQYCYIAEEDESDEDDLDVLAVANYRHEEKKGFAWLEGLAVREDQRSKRTERTVGRYMLDNLVEITRESGLYEIRLKSVPAAVSFYQRNGFVVMDGSEDVAYPHMSREIK